MNADNLILLEHSSAASARINDLIKQDLIMRDQADAVARREARRVVHHCLSRFVLGLVGGAAVGYVVIKSALIAIGG